MEESPTPKSLGVPSVCGLILGIASVFLGSTLGILTAFIAVILGFLGYRKNERLSLTGILIAGIVIIFLNLQGMGVIPTPKKNVTLMKTYTEAIRSSVKVFNGLKKETKVTTQKEKEKVKKDIIAALTQGLEAARKVEAERFDPFIANFSQHFHLEFMKGMALLREGYIHTQKDKRIKGAVLLDKWARWSQAHRKEMIDLWHAWQPQPSLYQTIRGIWR